MKLYIDTADAEKIIIRIDEKEYESPARQNKSQMLLPFILEKLSENGKTIQDITEISYNKGPGSFTGIRVGASVANAIAWELGLPLDTKIIYR